MQRSRLAAAAFAAVCATTPALAATSSSVTLSGFTVTLFDLDTNDGIAAGISFVNTGYDIADFRTGMVQDSGGAPTYFSNTSAVPLTPTSVGASTTYASASASVGGNGSFGSASLSMQGSANGAVDPVNGSSTYSVYADVYGPFSYFDAFTVSANTLVMFSLTADLAAATTVGGDAQGNEWANAHATFTVGGPAPTGGNGYQEGMDSAFIDAGTEYVYNPVTDAYDMFGQTSALSTSLGVSFANMTGSAMSGYLWATADITGTSSVAPVPEPQAYALMLGGLALVGVAARRRR